VLLSLLLYASFLANIGIGILNFSLVFYMRDVFGASSAEIGLMSSLWAGSYLLGCFILRRLSEYLGPGKALTLSSFLMAVFTFFILRSSSVMQVFVFYSMFGFSTAMFWPPLEGWISSGYEGPLLNKRTGRFNLSWSSALVLSPYAAGLLIERGLVFPLYAALGTYVILFVSFLGTGILINSARSTASEGGPADMEDNSTPLRFISWIGIFSTYLLNGIILFVFPLYARDSLGFSESETGLLLLFRALFSTGVFVFLGRTVWWHFNRRIMLAVQFMLALFCVVVPLTVNWYLLAVMLSFFGILFAFQYSSSIFHGVSGSINRERRMAVHESVLTAGLITGSVGGGAIYQSLGITAVFYSAGALLLLIFVIQSALLIIQRNYRWDSAVTAEKR